MLLADNGLIHGVIHEMSLTAKDRRKYAKQIAATRQLMEIILRVFDERTKQAGF